MLCLYSDVAAVRCRRVPVVSLVVVVGVDCPLLIRCIYGCALDAGWAFGRGQ